MGYAKLPYGLFGVLVAAAIVGCTVRTYYVKKPYEDSVSHQVNGIAWMMPAHQEDIDYSFSCIDKGKLHDVIEHDEEFARVKYDDQRSISGHVCAPPGCIEQAADKEIRKDHLDCDEVRKSPQDPSQCAPQPQSLPELLNPPTNELFQWLGQPAKSGKTPTWRACLTEVSPRDGEGQRNLCNLPGDDQHPHIGYQPFNEWAFTARRMLCENQGLFRDWTGLAPRDLTIIPEIWWLPHDRQAAAALKPENYVALLALSARPPTPAETKKGFGALGERAQAALINYAASTGKAGSSAAESASPTALVKALTKEPDAPFSGQRKVELTISGAVNSASARDRFEYLSAYVSISPLAGRLNARVSLERELLRNFVKLYYARPVEEGSDPATISGTIRSDIRTALDQLTVHIDAIDTIATQSTLINLGTLTTAGSLTASMGAPAGAPLAASGQAQLSATRVENIAKELDRRSVWLSRERTTLRITQRGMMEATISGSIVTVVTLRIPVSQMYALEVTSAKDDDDPPPSGSTSVPPAKPPVPPSTKLTVPSPVTVQNPPKLKSPARRPQPAAAKVLKIDLTEIDQPLYREVDAMNGLIATTRVQTPAGIANLYDAFQKEPDGLDFTVLQGPAPLKLWENNRHLGRLELNELVDLQPDNPRSYWVLGIWSQVPLTRQVAKFKSGDEDKFLTALHQGKIGLAERTDDESRQGSPADERGHTWYRFVSCAAKSDRDNAAGTMSKHRPAPGEVWLGMEGKYGSITGFDHEFEDSVGLARAYACCRRIPGTVNVCAKKHKL